MPIAKVRSKTVLCLLALVTTLPFHVAHAKNFIGYTGKGWNSDFGVLRGQCDAKLVQSEALKGTLTEQMAYVESTDAFKTIFTETQLLMRSQWIPIVSGTPWSWCPLGKPCAG